MSAADARAPAIPGRALAVTADAALAEWLSETLPEAAVARIAPHSDRARDGASLEAASVVVLDDRCLARTSGGARSLERWLSAAPALVLVHRRDPARVARLIDAGADDAMCAPFHANELRARISALMRRGVRRWEPLDSAGSSYDRIRRRIHNHDGTSQRLTPSEAVLIESLLEAGGGTVSRDALLRRLAAEPLAVKSNLVDRHVATLRAKLGDDHRRPRFVATVAGHGYRLQTTAEAGITAP